jgi:hypothetical protein
MPCGDGPEALKEVPMVLKSPVKPLRSPADGVIAAVAHVGGDSPELPGSDVGQEA